MRNPIHHRSPGRSTKAVLHVAGALLVATVLVSCGGDDTDDGAGDAAFNAADVTFAQGMIPHHAQAIEMSALVPERSTTPEVQALAEDIEAAQQPEIDLMSEMLEAWGEDVPAADGDDGHAGHGSEDGMAGMMSDDDMAALEDSSGTEFDQMWLTMMIDHHEGAITMSDVVLSDGADPDVADLAEEIIEVQQTEIDQMRDLLEKVSR
ncbi:DUF305 domain-containing protein [Phytoactinopolyspora limicola]|uniref:DUF305 domain-containing protein n=1 Tax=Phytoactinopolyspora limicola TaxID=2715536 RepID=UPI00140D9B83|nr:DUF305 domain-containing protein [Phytoactinopolyspora limicola]